MLIVFGVTILIGASLLFSIQPMFAKMVLPLLGGTPAVWNTCMVFFQAMLLAGYAYAHLTTTWLGVRRQAVLHLVVLLLPLAAIPIAVPTDWSPPVESNPVPWLLGLLAAAVGLPFFVVSASNPMLQKWFAATGHPAARDPYFLYGASNLGSMVALLGYPLVLERRLTLGQQSWYWSAGYGVLALATGVCAAALWRSRPAEGDAGTGGREDARTAAGLSASRRWRWIALSFIPSSLMLGVTTFLTTDIASAPLLWIIPLSLYLATFILVFSRRPLVPHALMVRVLPWLLLPLALSMVAVPTQQGRWVLMLLHLVTFFVAAMCCHGALAADRPPTRHLTEYYLWMSVGGVLGGMFNALLAPLLFDGITEYPIALVGAAALLPGRAEGGRKVRPLDIALPLVLLGLIAGLVWGLGDQVAAESGSPLAKLLVVGLPAMCCFAMMERPVRFGLGLGALLSLGPLQAQFHGRVLHTERSFFGVHRVTIDPQGRFVRLEHGTTYHGSQFVDRQRRCEPLAYYHRTGPIGDVFAEFGQREGPIAIIGLGCGGLAAYHRPSQPITFFEIDPAVQRIAENPAYFTYLSDCSRGEYQIVLGDGRRTIERATDRSYRMIFLDAFSSDAVPMHLLTREALHVYLSKLAEGGILIFNISNRYLDLEPVLGDLAAEAGLACVSRPDPVGPDAAEGKSPSHFVVMARHAEDLGRLARSPWRTVPGRAGASTWTDDYSNLIDALRW